MAVSGLPRLRIMTALAAAFAVVSMVPLVLSHVSLVRIDREALETAEKKYLTRSAVSLADEIRTYVRHRQTQLAKIADALKLANAVSSDKDAFVFIGKSALLADYVRTEPTFLVLRALDRNGLGGNVQQPEKLDPTVDAELQRVYKMAMNGEAVWGDPIRTEQIPAGGFAVAVPVAGAGTPAGVVEAFVSLAPIQSWLDDEKKRDVVAYVVDRQGNLLLTNEGARVSPGPKESPQKIELVEEFIAHQVRLTKSYTRGFGENAKRVLGTVAPVENPDWGVLVEKDEKQAFASVDQMTRSTTRGAGVALLLAVIAAAFAARTLSRPVLELVAKARSIAEGNYSQRVAVRGTRELAELGETFNAMSDSLEKSIERLKQAARENQELFINSIRTLAAAIDAKDPYTRGHSERVARYAVAIGKHYGLVGEDLKRVRISALLHDVGKIGIDDRILRKPTALTDEEFEVMKTHPTKGALIIGQIPQLRDIIPGIKYHHEKWEGGGYPDGLAREEIPMLARVVTVADTFDAMTTTRPYQKAMALDYVISRIKSFSGTRFDPAVIAALEKAHASRDLEVVGEAARLAVSA
ncbi:MAG TPA: HD domain-containing phosphohydrolase [Thermoanaerobaculia bacterium]|nr:HD domain-containing phosphohydrolase [Thermoanaerobaculia bacterium]